MKKLLFAIIVGVIALASCNDGKNEGQQEEIDTIALRAQTDTILSFNGINLGDTIVFKDSTEEDTKYIELATANTKMQVCYWCDGNYFYDPKPAMVVSEIHVTSNPENTKELLDLYMSHYGKISYYKQGYNTPITTFDEKVDSLSQSSFLTRFYENLKGSFVWEWANCSVRFEINNFGKIEISYFSEGYNKRKEEEKQLKKRSSEPGYIKKNWGRLSLPLFVSTTVKKKRLSISPASFRLIVHHLELAE